MRLIITRHGETVDNVARKIQGHSPGKLTDNGIEQADKLGRRLLDEEKIDYIYSSDLRRTKETALEIKKHHPEAGLVFDKRLRERAFGKYTGMHKDGIDWDNLSTSKEENGAEPLGDVRKRMFEAFEDIYKKHKDDTVLIVSHGTASRLLVHAIMGKSLEESHSLRLNNASVTIFEVDEKGNELVLLDCVKHLE